MIKLKPALTADAQLINQLAVDIWLHHYLPIIGLEQVNYMLQRMYAIESLKEQIQNGNQQYFLIERENSPIGFISFELKDEKQGFIHKFYLNTDVQGKGIGAEAFKLLVSQFKQVDEIKLHVNRQNVKAINFYFRIGFRIESCADFDIGNGYFMNDFIMQWKSY